MTMDAGSLAEVYCRVWSRCARLGALVFYSNADGESGPSWPAADDGSRAAYFWPSVTAGAPPRIAVFRERVPRDSETCDPAGAPNLAFELAVLAHEAGHLQSEIDGTSVGYSEACDLGDRRTVLESEIIMGEEERAWDLARALLVEVGVTDWMTFDHIEHEMLTGYAQGLRPLPRPRGQRG